MSLTPQEKRKPSPEGRTVKLEESQQKLMAAVSVLAHMLGVISDDSFREAVRYALEEEFGVADVERFTLEDERGEVYGHPTTVEVDVLVKDGRHILIEIKSEVSKGDVAELHRIGALYERKVGVKPSLVIVGGVVKEGVRELAEKLGVRIRSVLDD